MDLPVGARLLLQCMVDVLAITGSPSRSSRTQALAERVLARAEAAHLRVGLVAVRELPPAELLAGSVAAPVIAGTLRLVSEARALVVATPIYKAAYTGLLKSFLDLLPVDAFAGKIVLPLAVAGSVAHALALEHSLKPVLASLSPRLVLPGAFVRDEEVETTDRIALAVDELIACLSPRGT
jgi:FMN reductase